MNIIGTINFFFIKFLKEADKKHQSIMQIEKAAKVFAVQKSSAKLLTSKSLSKRLWIVLKRVYPQSFFFLFPHFHAFCHKQKLRGWGATEKKGML